MSIENIRRIKEEAKNRPQSYGIRRVSEKKKETVKEQLELANKDMDVYLSIWRKRHRVCFECGIKLGNKFHKWNAHHLLEKRNYPELRHNEENIILVCLECHSKAETNIDFAPKIKAHTKSLKLKLGL